MPFPRRKGRALLPEIERELMARAEALAAEQAAADRDAEAPGLDGAPAAPRGRAPRRRLPALAGGLAVVVAAALVLVFAVLPGARLDAVQEATAALAPPRELLHTVTETRTGTGDDLGSPTRAEGWSASDPLRWRVVEQPKAPEPGQPADRAEDEHGPITGPIEYAYAEGRYEFYVPARRTLDRIRVGSANAALARVPGPPLLPALGSPLTAIRDLLERGELDDAGAAQVDGREVRRLTGELAPGSAGGGERRPVRVVYDVDPDSFTPVRITAQLTLIAGEPPVTAEVRFTRFERLSRTPERERELAIQPAPGTELHEQAGP